MTQGKWWSSYAYEDDDTHVMHVKEYNHNTGVLQPFPLTKVSSWDLKAYWFSKKVL